MTCEILALFDGRRLFVLLDREGTVLSARRIDAQSDRRPDLDPRAPAGWLLDAVMDRRLLLVGDPFEMILLEVKRLQQEALDAGNGDALAGFGRQDEIAEGIT
jgi:hypothetical protein